MADSADKSGSSENARDLQSERNETRPAEQVRTTIGRIAKNDVSAAKRFQYLVDKTLTEVSNKSDEDKRS